MAGDPYLDGTHRYWTPSGPTRELAAALVDGWLPGQGRALDLGCGLGTEAAQIAAAGFEAFGVDISAAALSRARTLHPEVRLARADVTCIPFGDAAFDVLLDRGTLHYLPGSRRPDYVSEAWRVLRPGGRLLLRACLHAAGIRTGLDAGALRALLAGWLLDDLDEMDLAGGSRTMQALVVRARRPEV